MKSLAPITLLLEAAHPGASANYESWTRTVRLGTDFLYPFTLNDPGAAFHASWVLYHEIGHAFEDEYDLMDSDFTAPIGHFDPVRMAFIVPRLALKSWQTSESVYQNPSEAVASLFADYVLEAARLLPGQAAWIEARLAAAPQWSRAVMALRAANVPALVRSGRFDPDHVAR